MKRRLLEREAAIEENVLLLRVHTDLSANNRHLKEVQRHINAVAVYERGLIAAEVSSVPADCFHPEKVNPDTAFCAEKHQGDVFSKNSQLGE